MPTSLIPAHVDWHIGLRVSFSGGGDLVEHVVELFSDGVGGELARMMHERQIALLRHDDR